MIPDTAMIVAAYAAARLLNEFVLNDAKYVQLRGIIAIIALVAVAFFAFDIISQASDLGGLNI